MMLTSTATIVYQKGTSLPVPFSLWSIFFLLRLCQNQTRPINVPMGKECAVLFNKLKVIKYFCLEYILRTIQSIYFK